MKKIKKLLSFSQKNWQLILIIFIGGFFRFYKLDWGEGYFFHPDEYHIASSVNQLSLPSQMNPHFFSYGSFTIYLIYFSKLILEILNFKFLVPNPILIGRFYSALFSTLTILVIFFVFQKVFKNKSHSYLAAFLAAVTPGLIQQAHFTTPESTLTFWLFLTLYLWTKWLKKGQLKFLYFSAIFLGLALGTKISALSSLPILVFFLVLKLKFKLLKQPLYLIKFLILPFLIIILTFISAFPYSLIGWQDFRHSMKYETDVAQGKLVVFYTRQFTKTIPILFQYQKIFPYALGPFVLITGTLGLLIISTEIIQTIWKRRKIPAHRLLIVISFFTYFFPNAFLFTKWTRYIAPVFPFFAIFTAYFINKIKNKGLLAACYLLLATNLIWGLTFFSIYLRPDVRVAATSWLNKNLPYNSFILTEAGNMLEAPLGGNLQKISFDFYHLEENSKLQYQLPELLVQADYFIIQSRRIFINHQRLPKQFPKTSKFYDLLFSGQLGFKMIKKIDSGIPDENAEETWSVFDHPVIRIYQKTNPLSKKTYEKLLAI